MVIDNPGFLPFFSYIPDKANSAADVLSRNIVSISLVTDDPIFPELPEIKAHQRFDPFCSA